MEQKEFQKRCEKVFFTEEGNEFYEIEILKDNRVAIHMSELEPTEDDDENRTNFIYYPDMSKRPQALDYLLGKRDDFND